MSLLQQFQSLIGSMFFGSFSLFCWTLFNRIFYSKKVLIIRFPLEILLFCYLSYLYYCFLSYYSFGIFNVFYVPAFILGMYIYYKFYAYHFETLFEVMASSVYKVIIEPIKLKKKKICDKLKKKKRRKVNGKKTKQKNK